MLSGPDSVLTEEGASRATAMNPVEFFQIGIYQWEYKFSPHFCGENNCEQKKKKMEIESIFNYSYS